MMQIDQLTVYYENAIALNEMGMRFGQGEIVGVIGPNSAGKSTLMNTISGLILDTKLKEDRRGGTRITIFGHIFFGSTDITWTWPDLRAKQGIVLCRERHPVFRQSSVEENLKIAAYLCSNSQFRDRTQFIYTLFPRLADRRSIKAGLMSGGEQQMLAVGIALMAGPAILLLDEPLLGLSPLVQLALVNSIETINKQTGITVVVAEQFARPLIPIIHRGYVVENGMLAFEGDSGRLYDNPDVRGAYFGVDDASH